MVRPAGRACGRPGRPADRPFPRRLPQAAPGEALPGALADLPGARPAPSLPRRAPDPHVSGDVLVGPTALLAPSRDAYSLARVRPRDVAATLAWPGTWRMARRWWRTGVVEMRYATSRAQFAREAARYVPGADRRRRRAGVRRRARAGARPRREAGRRLRLLADARGHCTCATRRRRRRRRRSRSRGWSPTRSAALERAEGRLAHAPVGHQAARRSQPVRRGASSISENQPIV